MSLHRLTTVTLGVPDVAAGSAYYEDFGLTRTGDGRFASADGGEQLRLVTTPLRRPVELGIGADDADDLARVAAALRRLDVAVAQDGADITAVDAGTGVRIRVQIAPRIAAPARAAEASNGPGHLDRTNARAGAVLRGDRVRPRKLGHAVFGSTDLEASQRFFIEGIGFKVSDTIPGLGAFLRCSTDHHNLLLQAAPVPLLHHTSWQVDDVDEVGRAASAMLERDPSRHIWGLGRHHIGSNFFWYLKDPAGNFTEYYADLDCIVDDQLWTPGVWDGAHALYNWGPPPPPSFLAPDDLGELMAAAHS